MRQFPAPVIPARISHQFSAATAYLHESAALYSAKVLNVLTSTPARFRSRKPCIFTHLRAFASPLCEKSGLALVACCLMTAADSGFAQDKAIAEDSTLSGVLDRGRLRVCFEAGFMPFEMISKKGGLRTRSLRSGDERRGAQIARFVGFDVDIARDMARKLGVDFVPVNTRWSSIIPALVLGRCDIITSGMTITEERKQRVDFAAPYLMAGQTILLNEQLKDKVRTSAGPKRSEVHGRVAPGHHRRRGRQTAPAARAIPALRSGGRRDIGSAGRDAQRLRLRLALQCGLCRDARAARFGLPR